MHTLKLYTNNLISLHDLHINNKLLKVRLSTYQKTNATLSDVSINY